MRAGWPPHWVGRMTLAQLLCLASERPPDGPERITDYASYAALLEREQAEDEEWGRG